MTESATTDIRLPDDKPPELANSFMRWALTTPGIQSLLGQNLALLSYTGRRSGREYVTPVSYHRDGDLVTVITKRQRKWWHNFETPIEVELRLAGKDYFGKAEILPDDAETLLFLMDYFRKRPIDAKAYGLEKHEITRERLNALLPHIVVIRIHVHPVEVPAEL